MQKEKQNNDNSSSLTSYLIIAIGFVWAWIPLILSVLVNRTFYKYFESKKKYKISFLLILTIILVTIFSLSIYFFSIMKLDNFLDIIFLLLSIGGVILISTNVFFISLSKYFWNKRNLKIKELQEIKERMLKTSIGIDNQFFKKENRWKKWIFSFDILDNKKYTKKIEKIRDDNFIYLDENLECKIPESALTKHSLIVGTTGTGKTNTLLHFVNNAFEKNNKIIFIDGKADEGLIDDLANFSKSKNKKMILFTIGKNKYVNKSLYDPFGGKSESEIISILSEMEGFSESMDSNSDSSFYKKMEKGVFDFIIPLMKKTRVKIDFDSLYEWVQPNFLKNKFEKNSFWNDLFPGLEKTNKTLFIEKVENIKNDFKKIQAKTWETMQQKYLSYKNAFSGIVKANTTTLKQVLSKNNDISCLLISLNPMANLTFTKILANLITYDLKANADFNQTQGTTELIFDEIGSYASNSIVELLTQGRSKLYRVYIGVQGISQLKQVGEHFYIYDCVLYHLLHLNMLCLLLLYFLNNLNYHNPYVQDQ